MAANSSVRKNKLSSRFDDEGFHSPFPCSECVRLRRSCVRIESSTRCRGCVRSGVSCKMPPATFSDAEWRRLVESQNKIKEEEELLLAKLLRLRKQDKLLRKRAGDFIARDFKEIAELEELERQEAEELARIEKERVDTEKRNCGAESARAADEVPQSAPFDPNRILAATSEGSTLTQILASADPSNPVTWGDIDFDAFAAVFGEVNSSPRDNTVEPAGGSPSGSK